MSDKYSRQFTFSNKNGTHCYILNVETNASSFHLPLDFLGSTIYVMGNITLGKQRLLPFYSRAERGRGSGN